MRARERGRRGWGMDMREDKGNENHTRKTERETTSLRERGREKPWV